MKSLLYFLLFSVGIASAQNVRVDGTVFQRNGIPSPGASIAVCGQPASTSFTPCSPLVPLCASVSDGVCTTPNPTTSDGNGNYFFYVAPGLYTYQFYGTGLSTRVLPDQAVGAGVSPTGVSFFVAPSALPFGTVQNNTSAPAQIATITNTGTSTAVITGATFTTGTKFSSPNVNACNGSLPAGASCSISIIYTPTSGVSDTDTLTFHTNAQADAQNPLTVALSGSGTANPTFPITLTGLSGTGSGTVIDTNNANSLNCNFSASAPPNGTCTFNYQSGTTVILTATPASGSNFGTFGGAGLTTSPGTFTVSQAQTISATFTLTPVNVALNFVATGQGGGAITTDLAGAAGTMNCNALAGVVTPGGGSGCSGLYPLGSVVNISAVANASSTLVGFAGSSICSTTSPCGPITLNSNLTISVNFSANSSTVQPSLTQTSTNASVVGTTIAALWGSAQLVGDLIMCAIAFPDATSTVSSVADTKLNTYTQVPTISPKVGTLLTQALYYAQNIVAASAGANTTTATISSSASTAIAGVTLTTADNGSAGTTLVTSSVTLTNNNLITVSTWSQLISGNGPGAVSTVTGCGLTWQNVASIDYGPVQGTGRTTRSEVWRTLGAGAACAITVTWGTSSSGRAAAVSKFSGVDTTGSSGSGAIGITATSQSFGNPSTVTMGTFGSASNGTFGMAGMTGNHVQTAGTSMTLLAQDGAQLVADEWAVGNVSPVTMNLTTNVSYGTIAFEIKVPQNRRDMRCLEYAGIKQAGSPIDVSAAAVGTSAAPSSGGVTTGTANDLVTGFAASTSSTINAVSSGYTQRVKNSFGDDGEDQEGVPIATYAFAPTLAGSSNWIASQVAWLSQATSAPNVFSFTIINGGNGNGTVTSNAGTPNLNCTLSGGNTSGACSTQVTANSNLVLTATPQPGSVFAFWQGPTTCGTSPICTVPNITNSQNAIATFATSGVQNYFVNHSTGNDSADGLAATVTGGHGPWLTIGHAASSLTLGAGGTIVTVAHNTYNESVTLSKSGTSSQRIAFVCDAAWTVGGSTGCSGTQWLTFNVNFVDIGALPKLGFEFTGASQAVAVDDPAQCTTGFTCQFGNSIRVFGNYWHDLGQSVNGGCPLAGAFLAGQHAHPATGIVAIGNLIDHYGTYPSTTCNTAQGLYITGLGAIIENNQISRVASGAIQYYDCEQNGVISNNTIFNNHAGLIVTGSNGCTPGNTTVANNIVVNNLSVAFNNNSPTDNTSSPGHQVLYTNNDTFGNGGTFLSTPAATTLVQNSLSENPTSTFVNYTGDATGNYQLKGTSILINAGSTQCVTGGQNPCVPSVDFLNVSRPQRANFDVGAFELP